MDKYLSILTGNRAKSTLSKLHGVDKIPWVSGPGRWARTLEDKTHSPAYRAWTGMALRSTGIKTVVGKRPTYQGVYTCEEWHDYQTFAEWFYNEVGCDLGYSVDKDILLPFNKEYSPKNCGLVPSFLNKFFAFQYETNSTGFPGISERGEKWIVRVQQINVGRFCRVVGSFEEAVTLYKSVKKSYAKSLSELCNNLSVDKKYVRALQNFEVGNYFKEELVSG